MNSWVITNISNYSIKQSHNYKGDSFQLFSEKPICGSEHIKILIDGHVLPRTGYNEHWHSVSAVDRMLASLKNSVDSPIKDKKGIFVVIVLERDGFDVYTDRIGIKKVFYWHSDGDFVVSNDLQKMVQILKPNVSPTNILIHSLLHHFPAGITMFDDIYYTTNATHIRFLNHDLTINQYWSFDELLNLGMERNVDFEDFSRQFSFIVSDYLHYSQPSNVSLTLTGGMDSRTILATLLALGERPTAFTFGNPKSADVAVAREIANGLNLEHHNYFTEPEAQVYSDLVDKTVEDSNGLTHLHRAHRLDAIEKHTKQKPDCDLLFVGHMGGEGIRGLTYNSYFASPFFEKVNEGNWGIEEGLTRIGTEYCNNLHNTDLEKVKEFIINLDYFKNDKELNKYYFLYELVASIHHGQDINIYSKYIKQVVPIYLDIDYLELLFSTQYCLLKRNSRLTNPELYCNMINILYPELTRFQFSNNFSPEEYLHNRYLCAAKKSIRDKIRKNTVSNFNYGDWYVRFVESSINDLHPSLSRVYNIQKLLYDFKKSHHRTDEGYWHKFSNPVMFSRLLYNFGL